MSYTRAYVVSGSRTTNSITPDAFRGGEYSALCWFHLLTEDECTPPDEIRERRPLVRGRERLFEEWTAFQNDVRSFLDKEGVSARADWTEVESPS
jgi:hypothetical protein